MLHIFHEIQFLYVDFFTQEFVFWTLEVIQSFILSFSLYILRLTIVNILSIFIFYCQNRMWCAVFLIIVFWTMFSFNNTAKNHGILCIIY